MISKMTFLHAVILLGLVALSAGADDQKQQPPAQTDPVMNALSHGVDHIDGVGSPSSSGLEHRGARYEVENSDVLDLQFEFTPDFNQTVTVQPDGFVTLKEIGDIQVQGKTVPEIKEKLQQAYSKILAKPEVTVYLRDFNKPYFLALGQVARPGKYDLRGDTTVAAAVAMAGGFTQEAKHSQVLVFRRVNDNWSSVTKIDLKHMLKSRTLNEDLQLHPGDMVYVPQNTISKIKAFVPNSSVGTYAPLP
ncbi:MAG: polysaccharide biosynthesis/export family protein [Terriglobia bacterium]